jgi:hypothetical protein
MATYNGVDAKSNGGDMGTGVCCGGDIATGMCAFVALVELHLCVVAR